MKIAKVMLEVGIELKTLHWRKIKLTTAAIEASC
jgi:hypothetical protein